MYAPLEIFLLTYFVIYVTASRSTKGASKQRRDAINERVSQIRELLPVSEAARSRLSQLQVMALARSFISKSNILSRQYHLTFDVVFYRFLRLWPHSITWSQTSSCQSVTGLQLAAFLGRRKLVRSMST